MKASERLRELKEEGAVDGMVLYHEVLPLIADVVEAAEREDEIVCPENCGCDRPCLDRALSALREALEPKVEFPGVTAQEAAERLKEIADARPTMADIEEHFKPDSGGKLK